MPAAKTPTTTTTIYAYNNNSTKSDCMQIDTEICCIEVLQLCCYCCYMLILSFRLLKPHTQLNFLAWRNSSLAAV